MLHATTTKASVEEVKALIDAIPETINGYDLNNIEKARNAYDELDSEDQELVDNVAENQFAANQVIALIAALSDASAYEAVNAARVAYNALNDYISQKKEGKDPTFLAKTIGLEGKVDYWQEDQDGDVDIVADIVE
jgi:hypothetical protein